jgi:hypothetical protein
MATMKRVPGPARTVLDKALKDLDAANVRVGWFASSKYPDKNQTPVAYVAAINEYGPHKRPFMQPTADKYEKEWADLMLVLSKRIITGKMTVEDALVAMGLRVGSDIQKTISTITEPPLSLITLMARKARYEGKPVTGKTIGEFAAEIKAKGEAAVRAEVAGISTKPLNETGYMLATTSFSVNMKPSETVETK